MGGLQPVTYARLMLIRLHCIRQTLKSVTSYLGEAEVRVTWSCFPVRLHKLPRRILYNLKFVYLISDGFKNQSRVISRIEDFAHELSPLILVILKLFRPDLLGKYIMSSSLAQCHWVDVPGKSKCDLAVGW